MNSLVPVSPEEDTDAQDKIGNDTRLGAKELHRRWNVRLFLGLDEESDLLSSERTPFFGAGKLVELLSVVNFLRTADFIPPQKVFNSRGTPEPIAFKKDMQNRFLWVQRTRLKGRSGWGGRPDLLGTTSRECTVTANDFVIECKHVANLRSCAIRAEFGKGFDLGVKKYLIWSFYSPSREMVAGAAAIVIDLSGVGFDTAACTHDGCVALAGARQTGTGFRQRLLTPDGIVLPMRKTGRQTTCLDPSACTGLCESYASIQCRPGSRAPLETIQNRASAA